MARAAPPGWPAPDAASAEPAYQAALDFLLSLSRRPPARAAGRAHKVERTRRLLGLLGEPQRCFESILVAGTKGKGSTTAMLAALLCAAGRRVGRFTSPHLVSFRERIWVNGRFLPAAELVAGAARLAPCIAELERRWPDLGPVTTFEAALALACDYFARQGCEVAAVEVGIGGTHDATNALEPRVSLITAISEDHRDVLGPTLAEIAAAKAGILRPGRPAISAPQIPAAAAVLAARASELATPLAWAGREWHWAPLGTPAAGAPFAVRGPAVACGPLVLPLLGRHQRDNATLAIAGAHALLGGTLEPSAVAAGLRAVEWPGRAQLVPGAPPLLLDGAHNAASAAALRQTLDECFPDRARVLVLACSADKDSAGIVRALAPAVHAAVATMAPHERALPAAALAGLLHAAEVPARVVAEPAAAVATAARLAGDAGLVVVTGSLFLVGALLARFTDSRARGVEPV
jgi:dihydrofolate synthase/folylpolyglutamate synthase